MGVEGGALVIGHSSSLIRRKLPPHPSWPSTAYRPRLMRWMNTNERGTVAYWAMEEVRSNVWRTIEVAYSVVHSTLRDSRTGS